MAVSKEREMKKFVHEFEAEDGDFGVCLQMRHWPGPFDDEG